MADRNEQSPDRVAGRAARAAQRILTDNAVVRGGPAGPRKCPTCNGSGAKNGVRCATCHGRGQV